MNSVVVDIADMVINCAGTLATLFGLRWQVRRERAHRYDRVLHTAPDTAIRGEHE
jgi:hypothetical protein